MKLKNLVKFLPAVFVFGLFYFAGYHVTSQGGSLLTRDFIQYWSALEVSQQSGNPYDETTLASLQREVQPNAESAIMMYNPPWILTLLAPFLSFDLNSSAALWFASSLVFCFAGGYLVWQIFGSSKPPIPILVFVIATFYPVIDNLRIGQTGILLFFLLALFMSFYVRAKYILAGVVLALLTVKAHLFYLVFVAVVVLEFMARRIRLLVASLFTAILLIGITLALYPTAFWGWLYEISGAESSMRIALAQYRVATLTGFLRSVAYYYTGDSWAGLMITVPAIITLITILLLWRLRAQADLLQVLPLILVVSVFTSPYGWAFDQSVLLVIPVSLFAIASQVVNFSNLRLKLIGLTAILQALAFFAMICCDRAHQLFWFPMLLYVYWRVGLFFIASNSSSGSVTGLRQVPVSQT